jgi:hypothetical protein
MKLIPPTIKFRGNIDNAKLYKSYSLQSYNLLASKADRGGISFLHDKILLPDGTYIMISTTADNVYKMRTGIIEITGVDEPSIKEADDFYMESGFLFHESNFSAAEVSYIPSTVRFNDFTTNTSDLLINASPSRIISDGAESWAVGCPGKKLYEITGFGGITGDPYVFTSPVPTYCFGLRDKKLVQTRCPPGIFTGKLRLMVQSIYGSNRSDYTYDEGAPMSYPYFNLRSVKIDSGVNTSGLYKDPYGQYWLITMGATIYARKMVPSEKASKALKDGSVYKKGKVDVLTGTQNLDEAYLLSTLRPKGYNIPIGSQGNTSGFNPIAYGWKFNNTGDKVSIVVMNEVNNIPTYNNNTNTATTSYGFFTKLVTVSIGFDTLTNHPYVSSAEDVQTGYHLPYQQSKIFSPVYSLSIMQCLTSGPPGNKSGDYTAPIYCFYDRDDILNIITAVNGRVQTKSTQDVQTGFPGWWDSIGSYLLMDFQEPGYREYTPSSSDTNASGLLINSMNFTGYSERATNKEYQSYRIVLNENKDNTAILIDYLNPTARYDYNVLAASSAPATNVMVRYASYYRLHSTCMVIPFDDAEAVAIGSDDYTISSGETSTEYAYATYNWWKKEYWSYHPAPNGAGWGVRWDSAVGEVLAGGRPAFWGAVSPDQPSDLQALKDKYKSDNSRSEDFYLFSSFYPEGIQIYSKSAKGAAATSAYNFDLWDLIGVTYVDPFFYNPLSIRSSFSGAVRWSMPQSIGGNHLWPTNGNTLFSTPVGWA